MTPRTKPSRPRAILVAGLALFAMFFGAGNLIFPTMIGVEAGSNLMPAIVGFILTGVLLPALGIVATATASNGTLGLTTRMGKAFGRVFTIVIYLSIGVFYAVPRVATVSYETSLRPLLDTAGLDVGAGTSANNAGLAIFTLVFFAITAWLCLVPGKLVDRIGAWLTPALLVLLVLLITVGLLGRDPITAEPVAKYASEPLTRGLVDGYFTMDAMAAIVFGWLVIDSLRRSGFTKPRPLFGSTVAAGTLAGVLLAAVYLGLAHLGTRVPREGMATGADALTYISRDLFGPVGQVILGLIIFLACQTTAIGLIGASTQFFSRFFPKLSQPTMVMIHVFIAAAVANLGLALILDIIGPITLLIYPITIALIAVALVDIVLPGRLDWSYKLACATAAIMGAWSSLRSLQILDDGVAAELWSHIPLSGLDMAWVVPAAIALGIGLLMDVSAGNLRR